MKLYRSLIYTFVTMAICFGTMGKSEDRKKVCQDYKSEIIRTSKILRATEIPDNANLKGLSPRPETLQDLQKLQAKLMAEQALIEGLTKINRETRKSFPMVGESLNHFYDEQEMKDLISNKSNKMDHVVQTLNDNQEMLVTYQVAQETINELDKIMPNREQLQYSDNAYQAVNYSLEQYCKSRGKDSLICNIKNNDQDPALKGMLTGFLQNYATSLRNSSPKAKVISQKKMLKILEYKISPDLLEQNSDYHQSVMALGSKLEQLTEQCTARISEACRETFMDLGDLAVKREEIILKSSPSLSSTLKLNNHLKSHYNQASAAGKELTREEKQELLDKAIHKAFPSYCAINRCDEGSIAIINDAGEIELKMALDILPNTTDQKEVAVLQLKIAQVKKVLEDLKKTNRFKNLNKMLNYLTQPSYQKYYCKKADRDEGNIVIQSRPCIEENINHSSTANIITQGDQMLGLVYQLEKTPMHTDIEKFCEQKNAETNHRFLCHLNKKNLKDYNHYRDSKIGANRDPDIYTDPFSGKKYKFAPRTKGEARLAGVMKAATPAIPTIINLFQQSQYLDFQMEQGNHWIYPPTIGFTDNYYFTSGIWSPLSGINYYPNAATDNGFDFSN